MLDEFCVLGLADRCCLVEDEMVRLCVMVVFEFVCLTEVEGLARGDWLTSLRFCVAFFTVAYALATVREAWPRFCRWGLMLRFGDTRFE